MFLLPLLLSLPLFLVVELQMFNNSYFNINYNNTNNDHNKNNNNRMIIIITVKNRTSVTVDIAY